MLIAGIIMVSTGCLVIVSLVVAAIAASKCERESLTLLGALALVLILLGLAATGAGELGA